MSDSPSRARGAAEQHEPAGFSGRRAENHLVALAALGRRVSGSEQAEQARAYLRQELAALGLAVQELDLAIDPSAGQGTCVIHVATRIPGRDSPDRILLVAPYTGPRSRPGAGACERVTADAAAPALLLELARVLSDQPLAYELDLVFVDRGPPLARAPASEPFVGGATLLRALREGAELARYRLAIFFSGVGEPDLVIARDLYSHRTFRERFFRAATRIDHDATFPRESGFESPETEHRAFVDAGFRSVVAITAVEPVGSNGQSTQFGREPVDARSACSAQSLEAVGEVAVVALEDLAGLLRKVDPFVRRPEEPDAQQEGNGEQPPAALQRFGDPLPWPVPEAGDSVSHESAPPGSANPE